MKRLLAILLVTAAIGTASANAQSYQRGGYGTTGGIGTTGGYGSGKSFTAPAATSATTNATTSGDYQRVMNSVDGQDQSSDPNSQDNASTIAQQAATPYTANPTVPAASTNIQPSLATLPNNNGANTGYNQGLGVAGVAAANGQLTSPTGTVGLGAYNNTPYSKGAVTAPTTATAAPGPATPTYTGQ